MLRACEVNRFAIGKRFAQRLVFHHHIVVLLNFGTPLRGRFLLRNMRSFVVISIRTVTMQWDVMAKPFIIGLGIVALLGVSVYMYNDSYAGEAAQPLVAYKMVEGFYTRYISGEIGYRDAEALSSQLKARIDAVRASSQWDGVDPVVCSAQAPSFVAVQKVTLDGVDEAHTILTSSVAGHRFEVFLAREDGTWKIDEVSCL